MFTLDKNQTTKIEEWKKTHECSLRTNDQGIENEIYVGAIGGAITYCFTPTGIGEATFVRCACGDKLDVTDYDLW